MYVIAAVAHITRNLTRPEHMSLHPALVGLALLNICFVLCFMDHCLSYCLFSFDLCVTSLSLQFKKQMYIWCIY
jgi:hypothetical protein